MLLFLQPTFLWLTYMLVYIYSQRWPKVTADVCKRNRPFTIYGSIEKTLLDNWCVFVTINWINRSFKWIVSTNRQHMYWTAFWWQSQRVRDCRSRPNLNRSGRKLNITRPIVRQSFASRIQLWNGKCCSFFNKNLILAFILCAKIHKEPQNVQHNSFTHSWGYTHDSHADKYPYPHNRRADKNSYPHDRNVTDVLCSLIKLCFAFIMVNFFDLMCFIVINVQNYLL